MNMIEKRKAAMGQGGFTLIELLVVVAILAVLGGAAVIGIGALRGSAKVQVCKTDKETIETAAEAQRVGEDNATYSIDIAGLGDYLKSAPNGDWAIDANTGVATVTGGANADYTVQEATDCMA